MKIITLASSKGGTGKTTAAVFLAQALAHRGLKVLAVDLDPSNALTDFFLRDYAPEEIEARSVLHVLTRKRPVEDCIFPHELSLSVLGTTPTLATFPAYLAQDPAGLSRLSARLRELDEYDVAIIDTAPTLGPLLTAGVYAADLVLCPVSPHRWILQAFALLEGELASVEELKGKAVVRKMLFSRVSKTELERLQDMGFDACRTHIPKAAALENAVDMGTPLNPKAKTFEYFSALAQEVYP